MINSSGKTRALNPSFASFFALFQKKLQKNLVGLWKVSTFALAKRKTGVLSNTTSRLTTIFERVRF